MSGWTAAVLGLVLAMNPPGVARAVPTADMARVKLVSQTVAAVGAIVLGVGLLAGPLMDALSISTPTFRLGAALVIGLTGGRWLLTPAEPLEAGATDRDTATHLATLLFSPGPVLAALAATGDGGALAGAVSVLVTFGVTLFLLLSTRLAEPTSGAVTRFVGALTLVAAIAIGLDSARTV